jgi:hypothetical protein
MYWAHRAKDRLAGNGTRKMGWLETVLLVGSSEHLEENEQDTTAHNPNEMPDQENIALKNPYTRDPFTSIRTATVLALYYPELLVCTFRSQREPLWQRSVYEHHKEGILI